jgi:selenocysteine insertion sequence-binding protein 2
LSPKPTSSSTSKSSDKSKTKKKSKPTTVTLEQFISEKLKIDDEIKPKKVTINSTHNLKHKNKTQTHEMPNNLLDSSAPTRKRGKERENPKSKKPTTLKKIIIQEKSSSLEKSNNETIENDSQIENSDINDSKVVVNYDLNEINKQILHNKTYREYCNQQLSQEIDNFVVNLLSDLVVFQDRLYLRDPLKAKIRKRLSFGFREVTKYAIINKVKMLIIAPDIEKIETKGGLDDTLTQLLRVIRNNQTPVVFALTRRNLGITCKKKGFVSCVGVLNYDGSQVSRKIIS